MNCVLPSVNVKVLGKALQALSKVGDELYIEGSASQISFVTLNQSKTICSRYNFFTSFFSTYNLDKEEAKVMCKIHMKSLLSLFKGNYLDKKLEWIKMEYSKNSDLLLFKFKYKCDDIVMDHKLRLMEAESLTIEFDTEAGKNNICSSSSFYNQLLMMFGSSDDEITLEISGEKIIARNYYVGAPNNHKFVRTQVNLSSSEFIVYEIDAETTLNFSLKPFRTAIHFAEIFNLNLAFNFHFGGRPLTMLMRNSTFEAQFIVATLNPYNDASSSLTASSIPTKLVQLSHEKNNISLEDQQALESVNWDDFPIEEESNKPPRRSATFKEILAKNNRSKKAKLDKENVHENFIQEEVVPKSPESKRAKLVFGRCFEPTFNETMFGEVLAEDSDPE